MYSKSSMKTVKALSVLGSAVILALSCGTPAFADDDDEDDDKKKKKPHTLLVDDDMRECPDAGFRRIQQAVNAAAPGDIIEVCPGIYDEQVRIAKPLSLVGVERDGKNAVVVRPSNMTANSNFFGSPIAAAILVRGTSDVTITNITVDGINNGLVCDPSPPFLSGIFFRNSSGEIESVAVRNMLSPGGCAFGDGIDVQGSEGAKARLTVRDSSIHDYDGAGILSIGPGITLHAIGNVVRGLGPSNLGQAGIQLAVGATGLIEDNIVTDHIFAPCISPSECDFVSHNIGVFVMEDVKIARNIVGNGNVGIFAGAFNNNASSGVKVLQNRVSDSDVLDGIFVVGENSVVKHNIITNSDRAGVFAFSESSTIQNNTINEAAIGLLVSAGNKVSGNRLFNTLVTEEVFEPGASAASSQDSLRPAPFSPSALRKKLPR